MIPVPIWRDYMNPLAGLTVARLNTMHAAAARGQYAAVQWLYKFAAEADVTVIAAIARRLAFLDQLTWQVRPIKQADPGLAAEQVAALTEAYNGIENLADATRDLATAIFNGFAILDKNPADTTHPRRLDYIPPWFWIRPRGRAYEFNPETLDELAAGEPIDPTRLVVFEAPPAMKPISYQYLAKTLAGADWDAALMDGANPSFFFVAPDTVTTAEKLAEFQAIAEQMTSRGRGVLPAGTETKTVDLAARPGQQPPYQARIEYCDRQIVMAATGGLLTMLAEPGSGTLAGGAHAAGLFQLAKSDAGRLSEAYQRAIDLPLLAAEFPGQPVAAWFQFDVPQTEDTATLLEAAANLNWAGYRVDQTQLEEKTGLKLIPLAPEAPQ